MRIPRDNTLPFTNSQAELDLRMMKLRMKMSGEIRFDQEAGGFATQRSVLSSAREQNLNHIEVLPQG